MADELNIPQISQSLAGTIFGAPGAVRHSLRVASTNSAAMEAAAAGAPEGSVFLAEEQTAGRGRGGHGWHSEAGAGLYLSCVLRPKFAPSDALWLSLIAGLAAYDAIFEVTGLAADLRWPNDVMLGERKAGGILAELSADSRQVRHAVIGIGLNVNHTSFPEPLQQTATSLRLQTHRQWPRGELAAALLKSLHREYSALKQAGGAAGAGILLRFEQHSSYVRGAHVEVDDHGGNGFSGVTAGLDARGFLLVATAAGMRTVLSGGVRKVRGALP